MLLHHGQQHDNQQGEHYRAELAVLPLPEFPSYLCIASVLHRGNHIPF